MRNGERIIELQRQLRNSPEYQRIRGIERLSFTLKIFSINTAHLKKRIEFARTFQVTLKLGENRYLFEQYFLDIMRLLHNFVAASLTLIDHARRLSGNYAGHPYFGNYKREIKTRFAEDSLCRFVKDLRVYTQHYELPFIGSRVSVIPGVSMQHTVHLNRDQLLQWDHWSSHARAFLNASNADIDLYRLVIDYETKIKDFYDWYYARLREVHRKDITFVDAKQKQLLRLLGFELPWHLENELRRHSESPVRPEYMFNNYVDPKILYEVTRSDTPAIIRANILLDYVSKYSTIPEELRQRVIDAFLEYYETSRTSELNAKDVAERGNSD